MYALACTLGVFCLIVVLSRLKVPLAAAILGGSATLGLLMKKPPLEVLRLSAEGAVQPEAVGLLCITTLLLTLSGVMQSSGQMERIVSLARQFLRRPAVAMAALPALIGLLPMPGGALFSAPMVRSAAGEHPVEPARLSAINYWFRHIWEHWWPLYPGVILAMALTSSTFGQFALWQFPLGILMVAAGLLIFRGTAAGLHATLPRAPAGTKRKLFWSASSIWVIVAVWVPTALLVKFLTREWADGGLGKAVKTFVPIAGGLLASLAWTARLNRVPARALLRTLGGKGVWGMGCLVVSVMVFQYVLRTTEAAGRIAAELQAHHVPPVLVVAVLPFIAGAVTGLAVGFVGTSFPIVLPLISAMAAGGESIRPYVALAYAFGHLGQMSSPLHMCYVVSNEYFRTPFGPVYRHMLPSALTAAALTVGYVAILRAFLMR